jgi:hypothetical protein
MLEQSGLLFSNGITASDYYAYGLDDPGRSIHEKRGFLGGFEDYRFFNRLNPPSYTAVTEDKIVFHRYAESLGLPVPKLYAVVGLSDPGGTTLHLRDAAELVAWLRETQLENFVVKPALGVKGYGVLSIGRRVSANTWLSLPLGKEVTVDDIGNHCGRYQRQHIMLQARMTAHPSLDQMAPGVLHTFRLVTVRSPLAAVVTAVLRVGMGDRPADNLAQGGIAVPVDLDTGVCGAGTIVVDGRPRHCARHPVTGSRLEDVQVPEWRSVMALIEQAAPAFWFCNSVGWDVGLTEHGPVLIEANRRFDVGLPQLAWRAGILETPLSALAVETDALQEVGIGLLRLEARHMRAGLRSLSPPGSS